MKDFLTQSLVQFITTPQLYSDAVDACVSLVQSCLASGNVSGAISSIVNLWVMRNKLTSFIDRTEDGKRIKDLWYSGKYPNVDKAIEDLAGGDNTLRSRGLGVLIDTFDLSTADLALALNSFTAG